MPNHVFDFRKFDFSAIINLIVASTFLADLKFCNYNIILILQGFCPSIRFRLNIKEQFIYFQLHVSEAINFVKKFGLSSFDQASLCSRQRRFSDEVPVLVARRVPAFLRDDRQARMLPLTSTKYLPRRLFIPVAAVQSVSQFARHFRAHRLLKVSQKEYCDRLPYWLPNESFSLNSLHWNLNFKVRFICKVAVKSSVNGR